MRIEITDPYLGEPPATARFFDEDSALAELLAAEVLFANSRKYVCIDGTTIKRETIVLFVNCNDVFWWATADAEALPMSEVKSLYELWKRKGHWGATEWCCLQRKIRPQTPLERDMRAAGMWSEALEALPPRDPKECG